MSGIDRSHVTVLAAAAFGAGLAFAGCTEESAVAFSERDAGPPQLPAEAGGEVADAAEGAGCDGDGMADGLPRHLACTGLFVDLATRILRPGVRAYAPATSFWSDGTEKSRFVLLPEGAAIDTSNMDEWTFPVGTKLWKEFSLDGRPVETRLFWKTGEGTWKQTVYRWSDAGTDAVRLDVGETIARDGGAPYEIPSTAQCQECHSGRAEPVLGFDAVGLGLPGATGRTLAALASEGKLTHVPSSTELAVPDDGSLKAAPALAWLHANCGACHNPRAGAGASFTGTYFLLRASQLVGGADAGAGLDALETTCGIASTKVHPDGGAPLQRIAPGAPEQSATFVLARGRSAPGSVPNGNEQMPPLVTRTHDQAGLAALGAWIEALQGCP